MIIALLDSDNNEIESLKPSDSILRLLTLLRNREIETIVAGDVTDGKVVWEKQFQAVTVMPKREADMAKSGGA